MSDDTPQHERLALTRKALQVLAAWGVEPMDQCRLLGLPDKDAGRRFRRYRLGSPFPDEPEIWRRVALLLKLHNALNQVFPHSTLSADLWVTTPRVKFGNRTPLDLMLADGIEGIRRVERSLDNLDLL
jgi:uncharacterized protein (DUF2384 family)